MGLTLRHRYDEQNRIGDHICYISDLTKLRSRFPNWNIEYGVSKIVGEIVERQLVSVRH